LSTTNSTWTHQHGAGRQRSWAIAWPTASGLTIYDTWELLPQYSKRNWFICVFKQGLDFDQGNILQNTVRLLTICV
jgi:hypothetical protein